MTSNYFTKVLSAILVIAIFVQPFTSIVYAQQTAFASETPEEIFPPIYLDNTHITSLKPVVNVGESVYSTTNWITVPGIVGGKILFNSSTGTITDSELSVTSANIPSSINGVTVTAIGDYAFDPGNSVSALESVVIPSTVTTIGERAFSYCYELVSVQLNDGLTTINASAFYLCKKLVSVTIPQTVSFLETPFYMCPSLENIYVDENNPHYTSDDGILFSKDKDVLVAYPIARSDVIYTVPYGVREISPAAFADSNNLRYVLLPDGLNIIGASAFYSCENLSEIKIPEGVEVIASAFRYCYNLKKITVPSSVTDASYAFENTGVETAGPIGGGYDLEFGWVDTIPENAFREIPFLKSVVIPEGLSTIEKAAFYSCKNLTDIEFNEGLIEIEEFAFSETGLIEVDFPVSLKHLDPNIFTRCKELTKVTTYENLYTMEYNTFYDCVNLKEITFGSSVVRIGDRSFKNCENLETFYYHGDSSDFAKTAIGSENSYLFSAQRIYVGTPTFNIKLGETSTIEDHMLPDYMRDQFITVKSASTQIASVIDRDIKANKIGETYIIITEPLSGKSVQGKVIVSPEDIDLNFDIGPTSNGTVAGPSILFGDTSFDLLSFDISTDSDLFKNVLNGSVKFEHDTENQLYKVTIGHNAAPKNGSAYDELKQMVNFFNSSSTTDYSNMFKQNYSALKNFDLNLGFDFDAMISGYLEFDLKSGSPVLKEGGLIMALSADISASYPLAPAPMIYIKVGIKSTATGKIYFVVEDVDSSQGDTAVPISLAANLNFQAQPYVGVGIDMLIANAEAGLRGTLDISLNIPFTSLEELLKVVLSAEVYFKYEVLFFFSGEVKEQFAQVQLYPASDNSQSLQEPSLSVDTNNMQMMPRTSELVSYQNDASYSISSNEIKMRPQQIVAENIFQNAEPTLINMSDGALMAVWEIDDASRPSADRTQLVYSINTDNVWSETKPVADDGTSDFLPTAFTYQDEVYIAWNNATLSFGDSVTLETITSNSNISVAKFNGTDFEIVQTIDTDGKYPLQIDVSTKSDGYTITWLENKLNDLLSNSGGYNINSVDVTNFTAETPTLQVSSDNVISEIASGYYNDEYHLSYITYELTESEVSNGKIMLKNSTSETIIDDGIYNSDLKFSFAEEIPTIFWASQTGANLYYLNEKKETIILEDIQFINEMDYINNGESETLVYTVNNDFGSELVSRFKNSGAWSDPITLSNDGVSINNATAYSLSDGVINILFTSTELIDDNTAPGYPFGKTNLVNMKLTDEIDISIVGTPYYDPTEVTLSKNLYTYLEVKNNSFVDIPSFIIKLNGTNKSSSVPLKAGETKTISIPHTIASNLTSQTLDFVVNPNTGSDAYSIDNSASIELTFEDIEILNYEHTDNNLIVTVKNHSISTIDNVDIDLLDTSEFGALLDSKSISLASRETTTVTFDLSGEDISFADEYDIKQYYLTATANVDEVDYVNNSTSVEISPTKVESVMLTASKYTLSKTERYTIETKVYPENALNQKVTFFSSDENILTVDESGNIVAHAAGNAMVTAISEDGGKTDYCLFTVTDDIANGISGKIESYNPNYPITVNLYYSSDTNRENVIYTDIIEASPGSGMVVQEFYFSDIAKVEYDLVITKEGHIDYELNSLYVSTTFIDLTENENITMKVGNLDDTGDSEKRIDAADISIILDSNNYNKSTSESGVNPLTDVNGDGIVNFTDIAIVRNSQNYN